LTGFPGSLYCLNESADLFPSTAIGPPSSTSSDCLAGSYLSHRRDRSFNSTQTLTETLTDTNTSATFSTTYTGINLASLIGGSNAFVGFTGGTGGLNMRQTVQTWTFSNGTTTIDHSAGLALGATPDRPGNEPRR
jgi:hypothetical protein